MVYTIQDINEDPKIYIATYTTVDAAERAVTELEEIDKADGVYEPVNIR